MKVGVPTEIKPDEYRVAEHGHSGGSGRDTAKTDRRDKLSRVERVSGR